MNYKQKCCKNASLFEAIQANDRQRISLLLNDSLTQVDVLDDAQFSPLLYAVRQKNFAIVSDLLAHNASVDFGGGIYGSPLHVATVNIDPGMAGLLLQHGADPNFRDGDGHTPLHVLFSVFDTGAEQSIALSLFLMMRGADPNALGNENWAPIHLATKRNQEQALKFIADCGRIRRTFHSTGQIPKNSLASVAEFNVDMPGGPQRWTPLHIAAREGSTSALRILLQSGANPLQVNAVGRSAREVCGGQFECHKLLQRAEKDWLWWRVCSERPSPVTKPAHSSGRSAFASQARGVATHSRQHSRSWSLGSSVNSVASRRSIRKLKTRRFAQSAFAVESECTLGTSSLAAAKSSPELTTASSVMPKTCSPLFDRDLLVNELTEFMEPDISFDFEDIQIMQFNEFITKMINPNSSPSPPPEFYWSTEEFDGPPTKQASQVIEFSPPLNVTDSAGDVDGVCELPDEVSNRLMSPQYTNEVQAPLTARTHRRIFSSSGDRLVPIPTVLRTGNNTPSETPLTSRNVLRFASNASLNIKTPAARDQRPCTHASPAGDSIRLNTIMSALTSSDTIDENMTIVGCARRCPIYTHYQVLANKAPSAGCSYSMKKAIGYLASCLAHTSRTAPNRLTHLTNLYKLALSPGRRHNYARLCQFTVATLAGELRLSNSLDLVTIDTELTSTARILHDILYLFALANDEASMRQLFNRLSVDELISLRSVKVENSTLFAKCLAQERCKESTILLLLSYLPYDNRSCAFELHAAIKRRMLYVTRLLLIQGANPSATNANGYSALHIAILYHCRIILLALLYYPGLDVNMRPITSSGVRYLTALELALYKGNVFAISALVNRGACLQLGEIVDGRWRCNLQHDGEAIVQQLTGSISDPTKKTLLAAICEANHVTPELVREVTRQVVPHVLMNAKTGRKPKSGRSIISLMPGLALGPPVIVRSAVRPEAGGEANRLQLKRPSMLFLSNNAGGIRDLPPAFTSRCHMPVRVCNFCVSSSTSRSKGAPPNGALGECLNCSSPLCASCAVSLERIAQAAVPLLQDLTRVAAQTDLNGCAVLNIAIQYTATKSISNGGSARTKTSPAVACITVANEAPRNATSNLEQALSAAPKGILDVLSLNGGSLEAVWCSDSLVVSSGVYGLISKRDLAVEDHCAVMTGLHSVFRRLLHSLDNELVSKHRQVTRRKTVALCTPRSSQVRDGKTTQEAQPEERASAYGTSGVAHAVAEELWLGKNNTMQHIIRTAEILSLCPFCATYLSSTPCLLRRV